MKTKIAILFVMVCCAVPAFGDEAGLSQQKKDGWSYAMGVEFGTILKKQSIDANLDLVREGIKDVISGAQLRFTDKEMAGIKATVEEEVAALKEKNRKAIAAKNRSAEEKFLSENKNEDGVTTLPSGLQYKVIKNGTGPAPKEDDTVSVHYRVSLLNGTELESSYKKGQPGVFALENVIPGWKEGVCLMKTGSAWRFYVPSRLAYGEDGVGEFVEPNSLLVFELELLGIMKKKNDRQGGNTAETATEEN